MEQIYQIAWVCLITTIMINSAIYWIAPYYICPQNVCFDEGFRTIQSQAGLHKSVDLNKTQSILSSSETGASSGTAATTPPGFWSFLGGTVLELFDPSGSSHGGLISEIIIPIVTFVFPVQSILWYYANYFDSGIFRAMIYVIMSFFTAVQVIGTTFLVLYIAGLIRGVKA